MHVTLTGIFQMKSILSRGLLGIDIETGERKKVDLKLPVSMKRHLRRVLEAVDNEIKIVDPERLEFIEKWKVHGENKNEFPPFKEIPEFDKEYIELFLTPDIVIPFSPFHLELLDNHNEVIPDEIEGLMTEMNEEFKNQQKADNPSTGDSDKAPESAIANAV